MTQKSLTQHLIVGLLSLSTILAVPQIGNAASRTSYAKIRHNKRSRSKQVARSTTTRARHSRKHKPEKAVVKPTKLKITKITTKRARTKHIKPVTKQLTVKPVHSKVIVPSTSTHVAKTVPTKQARQVNINQVKKTTQPITNLKVTKATATRPIVEYTKPSASHPTSIATPAKLAPSLRTAAQPTKLVKTSVITDTHPTVTRDIKPVTTHPISLKVATTVSPKPAGRTVITHPATGTPAKHTNQLSTSDSKVARPQPDSLKIAQSKTTRSTAKVSVSKSTTQISIKSAPKKQVTMATTKLSSQQPKVSAKIVPAKPTTTTVIRMAQLAKSIKHAPTLKKPAATPTVTKSVPKPAPANKKFSAQQALNQINAIIKQNHFMGTLLVTNNGPAGVKIFTYGDANVAKKIANTNDEVYPLASLEKALTGAVIQRLINQHKLTMSTPLSRFYPQVPYARDITIRELLDHTSGIRMDEPIPDKVLTNETAAVDFTIKHLKSTNQHVWSYSNANFTLLAGIVSKVTGKSFMSNLQTDVLDPLGMKHTFVYNQVPSNMLKPLAYTYSDGTSDADGFSAKLLSSELGCGNVYASVGDYYTFINSLVTGKLDTTAGFMELTNNLQSTYSGGIYYRSDHSIRIGGTDNEFRSYYVGSNDGKVAVVLFANQGDWSIGNTIDGQIYQILTQASSL